MQSFGVGITSSNTKTIPNSTTTPLIGNHSTAAANAVWYEINMGSEATADNAARFTVNRLTTAGTVATSFTQVNLDPNGGAGLVTWDNTYNIAPTVGSNVLLTWGQHQRGTYRWVAYDYTKMIQAAVGTANGLAIMNPIVGGTTFNVSFSIEYME